MQATITGFDQIVEEAARPGAGQSLVHAARSEHALAVVYERDGAYWLSAARLSLMPWYGDGDRRPGEWLGWPDEDTARKAGGYLTVAPVCRCTWTELDRAILPTRKVERARQACKHGVAVPGSSEYALMMRGRCPDADKLTHAARDHRERHCHGGNGGRHAEHMVELAKAVLDSYDPKHRQAKLRQYPTGKGRPAPLEKVWEQLGLAGRLDLAEFQAQLAVARAEQRAGT